MTLQENPLPTAVVAGIDLNGLGVVRALARENIPILALDVSLSKPTAATRFGRKLKVPALSGPQFVESLLSLRAQFAETPVLILTEEASVATIAEMRERILPAYRISLPSRPIVEAMMDKTQFQIAAEQHGFVVPRSLTLDDATSQTAIAGLRYPCILKPAKKDAGYSLRFAKAYRAENADEVLTLWKEMRTVIPAAILQEWIVGEDSDVYFCLQYRDRPDTAAASFVGRKILQWPPLVGGTASCIPAPEFSDELTSLTSRFFTAVSFTGFCSMEYKRDRRDGRFYMVEPTVGRTDYQEEIATLNGVNIPAIGYWKEASKPPSPRRASVTSPVGWRDPSGEANARAARNGKPEGNFDDAVVYRDAYFRFDDPLPHIHRQLARVRARLTRLAK